MKGSDIIKINFIFIGTGLNNYNQAYIKIVDDCNKIVFDGNTYNGTLQIFLKGQSIYKIYAKLNNTIIMTPIYILDQDTLVFNLCSQNKLITFLLTDYHYDNLPIMKGEIIFGKNS